LKWYEAIPEKVWMAFFLFWAGLFSILGKIGIREPVPPDDGYVPFWVDAWAEDFVRQNKEVLDRMD